MRNHDLVFLKHFSMVIVFLVAVTGVLILLGLYFNTQQEPEPNPVAEAAMAQRLQPAGGVGVVSQSGGILGSLLSRAAARGVGLSKLISTSNEVDLELADFIDHLADDLLHQWIFARRVAAAVAGDALARARWRLAAHQLHWRRVAGFDQGACRGVVRRRFAGQICAGLAHLVVFGLRGGRGGHHSG